MKIKTFIVDAFTDRAFSGNPAGVCLLDQPLNEEVMQSIAAELNHSETAFIWDSGQENSYHIRYFTPSVEVDFCGHATLASSKVLLHHYHNDHVDFVTTKKLSIEAVKDNEFIKMNFPSFDSVATEPKQELLHALGVQDVLDARFAEDLDMLLLEVKSKEVLSNINPNFQAAIESSNNVKEVVITCKSDDSEYDFYSRCFCPWIGINEDPVTGAAHSVLAPYWAQKVNKVELNAYQLSKRGGFMKIKILGDHMIEVKSEAQIILEGLLSV